MNRNQFLFSSLGLLGLALPARAEESRADRIRERFRTAMPDRKQLAFYTLDWAMSLADAKSRAAKEERPIFLFLNTNISAGTNFFTGHT